MMGERSIKKGGDRNGGWTIDVSPKERGKVENVEKTHRRVGTERRRRDQRY